MEHRLAQKRAFNPCLLKEAFCQKMLLNRSPCTCTEKTSGADTGLFLPDPHRTDMVSVRSFSNSRLVPDPRAPHLPAPKPSARSRGPGSRSHRRVGTQTPGIRGRTCPCDPHNNADKSHSPLLAKGNGVRTLISNHTAAVSARH